MNKNYAGVAVKHKDSLLLAKRIEFCPITNSPTKFPGYWSIFCGLIEANESPIDCASRELFEEASINVCGKNLSFIAEIKQESSSLFLYKFDCMNKVKPKLNFEHTDFIWLDFKDLKSCTLKIDHSLLDIITEDHQN